MVVLHFIFYANQKAFTSRARTGRPVCRMRCCILLHSFVWLDTRSENKKNLLSNIVWKDIGWNRSEAELLIYEYSFSIRPTRNANTTF